MKLDILAIVAHPDDMELACAGTFARHIQQGYTAGCVDLTRGELGTRGSALLRDQEAADASKILGLKYRKNLDLGDGFFEQNQETLLEIITEIRLTKPQIVFANAVTDRHPDHGRGADLVSRACFLAGLPKIVTQGLEAHRPKAVYHAIQDRLLKADFCVDITPYMDVKMKAIMAFRSQFYDPNSNEPETPISTADFKEFLYGRAREFGRSINAEFGEGFTVERPIGVSDILQLA